eukprot:3104700-Amphidinium_carterae.1
MKNPRIRSLLATLRSNICTAIALQTPAQHNLMIISQHHSRCNGPYYYFYRCAYFVNARSTHNAQQRLQQMRRKTPHTDCIVRNHQCKSVTLVER